MTTNRFSEDDIKGAASTAARKAREAAETLNLETAIRTSKLQDALDGRRRAKEELRKRNEGSTRQ